APLHHDARQGRHPGTCRPRDRAQVLRRGPGSRRAHRRMMQAGLMVTDPAARGESSRSGAAAAPPAPSGAAPRPARRRRRGTKAVLGALGVLGFMATWELASRLELVNPKYLPPFTETAARLVV